MTVLFNDFSNLRRLRKVHEFKDDFDYFVTGDRWTLVTDDDGSAAVQDQRDGVVDIVSAVASAAGNEGTLLASTHELFLFAEDRPLYFEVKLQYSEANTDDANVLVGLSSVATASVLQDDGAGPPDTYDGCVLWKGDGQTVWSAETSLAGTQTTTQLTAANSLDGFNQSAGGASFQTLAFLAQPISSSEMDVTFYIDNVLVDKHEAVTMTTPEEMHVVLAVKDGSSNNEETLSVDYAYCGQRRSA